jgi:hypothetical protein
MDNNGNNLTLNCTDSSSVCFNKKFNVSTPVDTVPPVLHGYRLPHKNRLPYPVGNFLIFAYFSVLLFGFRHF